VLHCSASPQSFFEILRDTAVFLMGHSFRRAIPADTLSSICGFHKSEAVSSRKTKPIIATSKVVFATGAYLRCVRDPASMRVVDWNRKAAMKMLVAALIAVSFVDAVSKPTIVNAQSHTASHSRVGQ
jgi:hypothetical protein